MIRSMTGYGRHKDYIAGNDITVEVKSVNSRYLDLSIKLSRMYISLEDKLKQLASNYITRGKIDIFVSIECTEGDKVELSLNRDYLEGFLKTLETIKSDYRIAGEVDLRLVSLKPEVFLVRKADEDMDSIWQGLKPVAEAALANHLAMRENEGAKLRKDLLTRLKLSNWEKT